MKCRHVLLQDTSGSFKLAIRLPTKDYQPKIDKHKQAQKKWRDKPENKEWFNNYRRKWRKNLPFEKWEYYRQQKQQYMKGYYQKNRQHILDYHKQYYQNQKKEEAKRLKERTHTDN
jgi:hypothetical protein